MIVTTLNDDGEGSLRNAIKLANDIPVPIQIDRSINPYVYITFEVEGTIKIESDLPKIRRNYISLIGNFEIEIDFNLKNGLNILGDNCSVENLFLINSKSSAIQLNSKDNNVNGCKIGIGLDNTQKPNNIGILINKSNGNTIGENRALDQDYFSNVISGNISDGIVIHKSNFTTIQNNMIGLNQNDPTGDKVTKQPTFVRPLYGNLISGNVQSGVLCFKSQNVEFNGNFIGTDKTGTISFPNETGVHIEDSRYVMFIGCKIYNNPFVYYNVISGNTTCGIKIHNSTLTTIQGNFIGISATNDSSVSNENGVIISGCSSYTTFGGRIPLGNVVAGNSKNGIVLTDCTRKFLSFNTFCGLSAFGPVIPNGENGFLINGESKEHDIRTNVISGNGGNGILITENASEIEIICNIIGLNTSGSELFPNEWNGINISGKAHHVFITNDDVPSVIPRNTISGNKLDGILLEDESNHIEISGNIIGFDISAEKQLSNGFSAIIVSKTSNNIVIGTLEKRNYLTSDRLPTIIVYGEYNEISQNSINTNVLLERVPMSSEDYLDLSGSFTNRYYSNDGTY